MTKTAKTTAKLALFCVFELLATCTHAQTLSQTGIVSTPLQQTRNQIETEKIQFSQELEQQQQWLENLSSKKQKLANEVVDLKFSIAQKQSELQDLLDRKEGLQQQDHQNGQQLTNIRVIANQAANTLADLLGTLPPSESRMTQRQLLDHFNRASGDPNSPAVDMAALVELMGSLVREGHTSALFDTCITTPSGNTEQAAVLRVGHIFHACQTPLGEIYLRVASPDTTSGFRWMGKLDKQINRNIKDAITNANSSPAVYAANLPIDISRRLTDKDLRSTSTLVQKLIAGGPVMIPLAIVALVASLLIVERLFFILRQCRSSIRTAESILASCHGNKFDDAASFASSCPKVIAKVLSAALRNRHASPQIIEDAIQESMLHEIPHIDRFLPTIAVLAGVAPLLGLLGTITGMISTFDMITHFGTGRPQLMAGGISEALITTATGLVIAIPVLLMHNLISSKTDQLVADTERYAATLLNLIQEQKQETAECQGRKTEHGS